MTYKDIDFDLEFYRQVNNVMVMLNLSKNLLALFLGQANPLSD